MALNRLWGPCFRFALAFLALGLLSACQGSRKAAEQVQMIGKDARRFERVPEESAPETAKTLMGREPDAIQKDGEFEIHYYLVKGGTEGEAIRMVYKKGKLVSRDVVKTQQGN
jgi:hypothetical protein